MRSATYWTWMGAGSVQNEHCENVKQTGGGGPTGSGRSDHGWAYL